jgi:hypothetical protein
VTEKAAPRSPGRLFVLRLFAFFRIEAQLGQLGIDLPEQPGIDLQDLPVEGEESVGFGLTVRELGVDGTDQTAFLL